MADSVHYNEGLDWILQNDFEASTVYFALSDLTIPDDPENPGSGEHDPTDELSDEGIGEVSYWTGGDRESQAVPAPTDGVTVFELIEWATGENTDGPADVASVVACTTADDSGVALVAWSVGALRDMSVADATLQFTATLILRSPPPAA